MTWGTALGGSEHVNMGQTLDTFVSRKWVKLPLDVLFPSVTMIGTAAVVHLGESWQSWGWLHLKHDVYDYARVCMIMFDYVCMFDHICMNLCMSWYVLSKHNFRHHRAWHQGLPLQLDRLFSHCWFLYQGQSGDALILDTSLAQKMTDLITSSKLLQFYGSCKIVDHFWIDS